MSDHIQSSVDSRVMTVTINRADKKNAITQHMYAAMSDAIDAYVADDDIRALVFTGAGDMFTSGNDLMDFAAGGADDGSERPVARFLRTISTCPKILIAAVNGGGIGIGLTMTLHCDLVYAAETAYLSAPFVGLGVVPEAGSSILLPQAVGMAVANDVFYTGRALNAQECLQFGLVARVFPDASLMDAVGDIARTVASGPPGATRKAKALINYDQARIGQQIITEGKDFADQLQSAEFAESVAAKMQKRAPMYK